jgi:hypothetical protein
MGGDVQTNTNKQAIDKTNKQAINHIKILQVQEE